MSAVEKPTDIVWDVTYACPLRCTHCYSESGRRAARQLGREDMLRVADALISLEPAGVAFAGGEPLLVKGVFEVAERLSKAGVAVTLYTSGWTFSPAMLDDITRVFSQISVSVDGATAQVHDRIRGRVGAFDRAMRALAALDEAAGRQRAAGARPLRFGIDYVVVRSNRDQLSQLCTEVAPRFPRMKYAFFGAAVPSGLASRVGFADHELLDDDEAAELAGPELAARLQAQAPESVLVVTSDNRALQMRPDLIASGEVFRAMQVEPDGKVRAMPIYEGTVGSLLDEAPEVLWERAVQRWSHPVVVDALGSAYSMREWAAATRRIDRHFASADDLVRIERRPEFTPALAVAGGA